MTGLKPGAGWSRWTAHPATPRMGTDAGVSAIRSRLPGHYSENNPSWVARQVTIDASHCQTRSGVRSSPNYYQQYASRDLSLPKTPSSLILKGLHLLPVPAQPASMNPNIFRIYPVR